MNTDPAATGSRQSSSEDAPSPEHLTAWLARVADGDRVAFNALYAATARKLFGILLRLLQQENRAEEQLQETYIKIWQQAATFNPAKASAITWMASIARHGALDSLRKRTLNIIDAELEVMATAELGPSARLSHSQRAQQLQACLEGLEPSHARMIERAYLEGASRKQLAADFEQPVNTVKTWLHRGLSQLKSCLGDA